MTNPIKEVQSYGQSIWYDNIRRAMLTGGELRQLRDDGVMGVTSNPTIFEKAIAGSKDYDETLRRYAQEGRSLDEIYEGLVLEDIARAADIFNPVYEDTQGRDGYISLEVRPTLADDTQATVDEARRLFAALARKNVMIKVPATPAGIPAIETLIAEGVNVNVTLIFSLSQYKSVVEAYLSGLEKWLASNGKLSKVASVASFFVSRVDTAVDRELERIGETELQGKIAIANAKDVYARFRELFSGERWEKLAAAGARVQRPLWASTGTKNPAYPDTLYLDSLIGRETVNTVPPATLAAFGDHGQPGSTLDSGLAEARDQLSRLADLGVDLEAITQVLLADGVASFSNSFTSLLASIREKQERLLAGQEDFSINLGSYQTGVDEALAEMKRDQIMARIWAHKHAVWKPDPGEITNRLGWLHTPELMVENTSALEEFARELSEEGYTHALLLGMGGSSLAPEVFRKTFGVKSGYLDLAVLDSTDPGAVLFHANRLADVLDKTLFIVSTKSGGTVETLSFFKFFYNRVADELGDERAGEHFIAITDPGSRLQDIASRYQFRTTFLNDPNIGGRYAAISYFGLVPAALIGVDLDVLLDRALTASSNCDSSNCPDDGDNNGARLGVIISELARAGRDKLTLITSPEIASFGDWVEQLIAESTGKEGIGILPVVGEPVAAPELYGDDRLFIYLRLEGDGTHDDAVNILEKAGHPIVRLYIKDLYDIGGQFFLWEMATAVAGYRLGINPFDQPNVEAAKVLARQMVASYQSEGELPSSSASLESNGVAVYGDVQAGTMEEVLGDFLSSPPDGAYITLQAYVKPGPGTDAALLSLRDRLRSRTHLATTAGYGPRFLHSTGQLHKGDGGRGLFLQFTADSPQDVDIPDHAGSPDSSISFGTLKMAQALGDAQALRENRRRVIRFHFKGDVAGRLRKLAKAL